MAKRKINTYVRLTAEEAAFLEQEGGTILNGLRMAVQLFLWCQRKRKAGQRIGAILPNGDREFPVVFDL